MAIKLKPCPFCGGKASFYNDFGEMFIQCENCLSRGPLVYTPQKAIKAWNRRAEVNNASKN